MSSDFTCESSSGGEDDTIADLDAVAVRRSFRRVSMRRAFVRRESTKLTEQVRRLSLMGLLEAEDFTELDCEGDDDDDGDPVGTDGEPQDDIESNEDARVPRSSVLVVPSFQGDESLRFAAAKFRAPIGTGSVDLGTKNFMAKIKDYQPRVLNLLREKKVYLAITLGSQNTELARLDAILQWVTSNYDSCVIMTGDYVYRLTLQLRFGLEEIDAVEEAIAADHAYKAMCSTILSQYSGMCNFIWMPYSTIVNAHKEAFGEAYTAFKTSYETNKEFRSSVKTFGEGFCQRFSSEDADDAAIVSVRNVLEELAVYQLLCKDGAATVVHADSSRTALDICAGKFQNMPTEIQTNFRFILLGLVNRGFFFKTGERKVLKIGPQAVGTIDRPATAANFLGSLEVKHREMIAKISKPVKFRAGLLQEQLDRIGIQARDLIIIEHGRAEELLTRKDNGFQRVFLLNDGAIVDLEGFLDGTSGTMTINFLDETQALIVSRRNYEKLLEKKPEYGIAILRQLAAMESARCQSLLFDFQHMDLDHELFEDVPSSLSASLCAINGRSMSPPKGFLRDRSRSPCSSVSVRGSTHSLPSAAFRASDQIVASPFAKEVDDDNFE